jgi:hypothetical protein
MATELIEGDRPRTIDAAVVPVPPVAGCPPTPKGQTILNISVELPALPMAGSDGHDNADLEVGQHRFALLLAPDAEYPALDVNGTTEQLDVVVGELQAALAAMRAPSTETPRRSADDSDTSAPDASSRA